MRLLLLLLLSGCSSVGSIYGNPFGITPEQSDRLLKTADVMYVSPGQLTGFCPILAANTPNLADCVAFGKRVRVFVRDDMSPTDTSLALRHAASHIYAVDVLGSSVSDSINHIGW